MTHATDSAPAGITLHLPGAGMMPVSPVSNVLVIAKLVIFILVVAMIGSLFSALWYMMKDRGEGTRTVKALTWRISIWVVLFGLLALGVYSGLIQPSNSLRPPAAQQPG